MYPLYFITFCCYGTHLPGQAGAVDRDHNTVGGRFREEDATRESSARRIMLQEAYTLDAPRRAVALAAIRRTASLRHWTLLAAHIRTNHVHVIVEAEETPERVMNVLKSYASRALSQTAFDTADRKRWARHGSTKRLWTSEATTAAVRYVVAGQGEPMAVFELMWESTP